MDGALDESGDHGNLRTTTSQECAVVPRRVRILRLIDSCITQLKAQGLSRTCNESKEEA